MGEFRTERVGRLIQEKIGAYIVEGRIKDPRVHPLLSVTRVSVSRDLAYAEVYVSICNTPGLRRDGLHTGGLKTGVAGLQSAAGFIQSQLAMEMHIRKTPRLRFHEDVSIREGFDMVRKIEEIAAQDSAVHDSHEGSPAE